MAGPPNALNNKNIQNQFNFFNKKIQDIKEQQKLTNTMIPRLQNRLEVLLSIPERDLTNNHKADIQRIRETLRAMKINSAETEALLQRIVQIHKQMKNNYF